MKKLIKQGRANGLVAIPPSKSYMQRAMAIASLAEGKSIITNPSLSKDGLASMDIIRNLGCKVDQVNGNIEIEKIGSPTGLPLDAGESGTSLRLFASIAALYDQELQLTGSGSLKTRPMHMIFEGINNAGAWAKGNGDFIPINLKGPIKGGPFKIDGSETSQVLTGLLIALPIISNDSQIEVSNLSSKPYIDITIDILKSFGVHVSHEDYKTFNIKGSQKYSGRSYEIEGDWSGASFHVVGAAISGKAILTMVNPSSVQADIAILEAVKKAGASIKIENGNVVIEKDELHAFNFDALDCPDLFPPIAALAANCNGISKIKGVQRLTHKESDRYTTIKEEFAKLGIRVWKEEDSMLIEGGPIQSAKVHGRHDHRIAMCLAIAALNASGPVEIENAECVSKSYPNFYEDFEQLYNS